MRRSTSALDSRHLLIVTQGVVRQMYSTVTHVYNERNATVLYKNQHEGLEYDSTRTRQVQVLREFRIPDYNRR